MLTLANWGLSQWFVDFTVIFGVVGTAATLLGLWLTWQQVQETKKAAEAARDAALATAAADRNEFARFAITGCHRLIGEAKLYVDLRQYDLAALRSADLADQMASVGRSAPNLLPGWESRVETLRNWEGTLKSAALNQTPLRDNSVKKWREFVRQLYATIDPVHGPFNTITDEDWSS